MMESQVAAAERQRIDDLMRPIATLREADLDREIGARAMLVTPLAHCLVVARDHGATALDTPTARMHGSMPAPLQGLYANLIGERDPLAARAHQEWRPHVATIEEHVARLKAQVRNPDLLVGWLRRNAESGGAVLAVVPARAWLSRACLFAFAADAIPERDVFALFYAAQRLAVALELRGKPYIGDLLEMRFTARELDVLRAGLRGTSDEDIASGLGLSVDAIRYYFKKFKHRVPAQIGHLKPRDLSRILHHLGKL
ncbi:MAG TPA: hypothetical protein VMU33_12145 [Burkholderiaceae bacterium]|nr:hypothetical protein [Burkholderiaceae bacterium]